MKQSVSNRTLFWTTWVFVVTALLAGCGGGKSKKKEVIVLEPVPTAEQAVEIEKIWSRSVGGNAAKSYVTLVPGFTGELIVAAAPSGRVVALDKDSGAPAWEIRLKEKITAGVGAGIGLAVVATDDGEVVALDAVDGGVVWRQALNRQVLAAPAVDGDLVIVQSVDGQVTGFASADGERRWSYRHTEPGLTLRGTAQPLVIGPVVVAGFGDGLLVASARTNGEIIWQIPVARPSGQNEIERLIDVDTQPVVAGGTLYAAVYQGRMIALEADSGNLLWTRDISTYSNLSADGGNVYVMDADHQLHAIDRATGNPVWVARWLRGRRPTGPAATGRHVAVGDGDGYLYLIDKDTGDAAGLTRVSRDPIEVTPTPDGNRLYVQTAGGTLALFRPRAVTEN